MTSERSQAYGRVVKAVDALSASKLHAHEQDVLKEAADALIFCEDLAADADARGALEGAEGVLAHLVEAGRLTEEAVERLLGDLEACGPVSPIPG